MAAMKQNIILLNGPINAGKSTIGRKLAAIFPMLFLLTVTIS